MGNRNKDINRIIRVYKGMRERCNNPNSDSYRFYGAKGIKVLCSRRDFVEWYLDNVGDTEKPHVDRVDPGGHYKLSNMQIISATENCKKTFRQNPRLDIKLRNLKNANEKKSLKVKINDIVYPSLSAASRALGRNRMYLYSRLFIYKLENLPDGSRVEILES